MRWKGSVGSWGWVWVLGRNIEGWVFVDDGAAIF